jgi:presenilin-like A22 family membrane protease
MEEKWNITNPEYDLFSIKDFFGLNSIARITILIFIVISFFLNFFILLSIIRSKRKKTSVGLFILSSILVINFIHVLSYLPEWVIKETKIGNKTKK